MSSNRQGFTIVEMLIVSVLGAILLVATYEILVTNQRTYTAQNAQVQARGVTRAISQVLQSELREISPSEGDLVRAHTEVPEFRVQRGLALVCGVTIATPPILTAVPVGDWLEVGDSISVFADNQVNSTGDDTYIYAEITAVDTTATCSGRSAQTLTFAGQSALFTADTVRSGAPVRAYQRVRYGISQFGTGLQRQVGGESWVDLVGTNLEGGGTNLEFEYLDENGDTTVVETDVAQIRVHIRVPREDGSGTDTLITRIQLRN